MRSLSSTLALRLVAALAAADDRTLSQIARAVAASASAVQRALGLLVADEIVDRAARGHPTYRLGSSERAATVTTLALSEVPFTEAVTIGARANPAIESTRCAPGPSTAGSPAV